MPTTETWRPSDESDPLNTLRVALSELATGNHANALAKLVWLYESPSIKRSRLTSVRRTFVLEYWRRLGEVYLPASESLHSARDVAESDFYQSGFDASCFQDLVALNRVLCNESNIVDVFKVVDRTDWSSAAIIYSIAESSLLTHEEYELCAKYVDSERRVDSAIRRLERANSNKRRTIPAGPFRRHLIRDFANLITILFKTNQISVAKRVCAEIQSRINDEKFDRDLRLALAGVDSAIWTTITSKNNSN